MATPREFMERVVAWPGHNGPGYINLHWQVPSDKAKGSAFRGKPYRELVDFMGMAEYAATKPGTYKELYFCLSTQSTVGRLVHGNPIAARSSQTAIRFKSIWLDVDVKKDKGYDTIQDAIAAIAKFTGDAQLPPPSALVLSGGGVHAYWISRTPLDKAEWRPYAEGLRAEAQRYGLKCDAGITTDEARVLRIPGTFNNKTTPPRAVRLAHLGDDYEFGVALQRLATAAPVAISPPAGSVTLLPFDLSAFTEPVPAEFAGLDPKFDNLASGITGRSDLPLDPAEVLKGCSHFFDCAKNNGKGHGQGLWSLTLLASTFFKDGREWAHKFSSGYDGYDKAETDAKFDEKERYKAEKGLGWPSCRSFENEGAACKQCPFYGKLNSPLRLAERVQPPQIHIQEALPPPPDLDLPTGYTVNEKGWICEVAEKTLSNGLIQTDVRPLFMCKLRNPVLQRGNRRFMCETSLDGDTWGRVVLRETDLASDQAMLKALREHGVKPFVRNQRGIAHFMTSWMAKLDEAKKRIDTIAFGWHRPTEGGHMPDGFAYGGTLVMAGGATQLAGYTDAQIESHYQPKGDESLWYEALKMIVEQNRVEHQIIISASLGAPLLFALGNKYNCTMCVHSDGSGAHKSTAIAVGAAIWGSPKLTKERPLSSQKGIIRKIGHLKNLPVFWDEIDEPAKMDEVRQIVTWLSEGGGGSKLRQDRTLYEIEEWQTLMVVGSNLSLVDNILRNTTGTDAKLQRVFEFEAEKVPDSRDQTDVSVMIGNLDYNYGHIGVKYAHILGRDPASLAKFVANVERKFNREVDHVSEERYRSAIASVTFAGAMLGNQLGCGFDLEMMWTFLKKQYHRQRQEISASNIVAGRENNTVDHMTQFFKAHVENILWVGYLPVAGKAGKPTIVHIAGPTKDSKAEVEVRFSVADRIMDISKKRLAKWINANKGQASSVMSGLKKYFGAEEIGRVDISYGASVGGGRETILRVPIPAGSPFVSMLYKHTPVDQRPSGEVIEDEDIKIVVNNDRKNVA